MISASVLAILFVLNLQIATSFNEVNQDDNTVLSRNNIPLQRLERPFRRKVNNIIKPLRNFATGLDEKDQLWLLLPWKLGKKEKFPLIKESESTNVENGRHSAQHFKKIFLGVYPLKLQGGELHGFAMAEMACRQAGRAYFGDGGFRALLTSHHRPLEKIMPRHLHDLPLVNLHGDLLARDWQNFLYGRLTNNTLISMDGTKEEFAPRRNWKYYWLGDGYRRTCASWTSSYLMDVANVFAFDYANQEVVHDIASCSSNLHLLCYSVCEDTDQFL